MKEVLDKLEFEVTQEDIDNGIQGNCKNCAISLAVKRIYGSPYVETNHTVVMKIDRSWYQYELTEEAEKFISNFDYCKKDVKPQKFSLELWT